MLKKIIIIIIITLYIITINKITNTESEKKDNYYGYITIPALNIKYGFYDYDNPLNNVDQNVMFINTYIKNTYLLAAHSGSGKVAYFNDLINLKISDFLELELSNKKYKYKIINIYNIKKNGKINIKNKSNQLILTTCNPILNGYQLIIESILI